MGDRGLLAAAHGGADRAGHRLARRPAFQQMLGTEPLDGLADDGAAAGIDDAVGGAAEQRIGDQAGARIGTAAFEAEAEARQRHGRAAGARDGHGQPCGGADAALGQRHGVMAALIEAQRREGPTGARELGGNVGNQRRTVADHQRRAEEHCDRCKHNRHCVPGRHRVPL